MVLLSGLLYPLALAPENSKYRSCLKNDLTSWLFACYGDAPFKHTYSTSSSEILPCYKKLLKIKIRRLVAAGVPHFFVVLRSWAPSCAFRSRRTCEHECQSGAGTRGYGWSQRSVGERLSDQKALAPKSNFRPNLLQQDHEAQRAPRAVPSYAH